LRVSIEHDAMSTHWNGQNLVEPLTAEQPCGRNLEDTDTLASIDAYQIFGQTTLEAVGNGDGAPARREARKSDRPPDWEQIREEALAALRASKDLRLLAHLGAASLRLEGIPAFVETLTVASSWLKSYWSQVYPLVDEDAIFRQSALNCFADPVAVIDGLRRAPLVSHRQHGRFSVRDLDIAVGQTTPSNGEARPDEAQINAAFAGTPIDELKSLQSTLDGALTAVGAIDGAMRDAAGSELAPNFEGLSTQFKKIASAVRTRVAEHPNGSGGEPGESERSASGDQLQGSPVIAVGGIRSRQDAIRALDAAAEFFRRNEPSSPIPLFLERAKRLVSKDFLEVLADIAPDALPQAKAAGGVKDE
jgi:type VI secretion system protein ImpA